MTTAIEKKRAERLAAEQKKQKQKPVMIESKDNKWNHDTVMEPENLAHIPDPTGYRMVVVPYDIPEYVGSSGIIVAESIRDKERLHATSHRVIKMGPDCYTDQARYPDGPWCKVGDFVLLSRYCGSKFNMAQCDVLHVINEDEVLCVVEHPEDLLTFAK